jgi:hypothetical protein
MISDLEYAVLARNAYDVAAPNLIRLPGRLSGADPVRRAPPGSPGRSAESVCRFICC